MKDNSHFTENFIKEAAKHGGVKSMADVVGMPDQQDEEFLRRLVARYEEKTKGLLGFTVRQARREFESGRYGRASNVGAVVNKQSNLRYQLELPESFVQIVEHFYPTLFTDKKHFAWFKSKLPGLMIRSK